MFSMMFVYLDVSYETQHHVLIELRLCTWCVCEPTFRRGRRRPVAGLRDARDRPRANRDDDDDDDAPLCSRDRLAELRVWCFEEEE